MWVFLNVAQQLDLNSLLSCYHCYYQVKKKSDSGLAIQPLETKLDPRLAKFISLICNVSMMKQQMMEIGQLLII